MKKKLNIFHANVNGLESKTKLDNLQTFLSSLDSAMNVVAITETSEQNNNISFLGNVSMEGYKLFHTPTNSLKGGTALYIDKDFNVFERIDIKAQTDLYESTWVEIKNKNSKNIVCGCIYRHPNTLKDDYNEFFKYMDKTLKQLVDEKKEIYICGDFNIDFLKMNEVESFLDFYTLINSHGFLPLITQPTRVVDSQTPSLIDNILSNNITDPVLGGNIYLTISEHFSQFASIDRGKIDIKKMVMYGRDRKNFDGKDFRDDVAIQRWSNESDDPSFLMQDMIWRLDGCVERHAPTKKLSPKEVKLKLKPWITKDIQKMMSVRDRLFARKKRQPENELVRNVYNKIRNKVNRELEKSKKEHYDAYFDEHNTNIKKTWEGIRKMRKEISISIWNPITESH